MDNFVRHVLGGKRLFETHDEICHQVAPQSKIWVRIYETISQRIVILTYLLAGVALCFIL